MSKQKTTKKPLNAEKRETPIECVSFDKDAPLAVNIRNATSVLTHLFERVDFDDDATSCVSSALVALDDCAECAEVNYPHVHENSETTTNPIYNPNDTWSENLDNVLNMLGVFLDGLELNPVDERHGDEVYDALKKSFAQAKAYIFPVMQVRLLKNSKVKNGKRYDNLYLQVRQGNPIAIKLSFDNFKVKNMLLAIATPCEIRQTTIVRELDGKTEF